MGMQIPRDLHTEMAQEADLWSASEGSGIGPQRTRATEGKPSRGRAFDGRSRSHAGFDSTKVFGCASSWIHKREERNPYCANVYGKAAELCGPEFLGARIFCFNGRPR